MTWSLFEITHERAKQTMRRHGFVPADEKHEAEIARHKAEAIAREPIPYEEASDELKAERIETLQRRLTMVGEPAFYDPARPPRRERA